MNEVIENPPSAFGYPDNISIFSESVEKCFEYLRAVFARLRNADLKLKKCYFSKCELPYIGNLISGKGMYQLPEYLKIIEILPMTRTPKEVREISSFNWLLP